jgi:hypothetical protein
MAIRTAGGHEVEITGKQLTKPTVGVVREVGCLTVTRKSDGYVYHGWQVWGLVADGGAAEIREAVEKAAAEPDRS